jgi:hypothetical protein
VTTKQFERLMEVLTRIAVGLEQSGDPHMDPALMERMIQNQTEQVALQRQSFETNRAHIALHLEAWERAHPGSEPFKIKPT